MRIVYMEKNVRQMGNLKYVSVLQKVDDFPGDSLDAELLY